MKKYLIGIIAVAISAAIFFISVSVIWLPDLFTGAKHVIASVSLANGNSFTVVQYWNRTDFYSTELHHRCPDGNITVSTLDGDDRKSWKVPIAVDEQKRLVTVTLSGGRSRIVSY
ncbi:MAG: hypothetical protein WC701_14615 [Kiritimatiellales bacterium]|jgi:hypothetical protein